MPYSSRGSFQKLRVKTHVQHGLPGGDGWQERLWWMEEPGCLAFMACALSWAPNHNAHTGETPLTDSQRSALYEERILKNAQGFQSVFKSCVLFREKKNPNFQMIFNLEFVAIVEQGVCWGQGWKVAMSRWKKMKKGK